MGKKILFNSEARAALKTGVDIIANAVKVTLGPKGRNVVIARASYDVHVTKDGVTVANSIELTDPVEQVGAQMIKEVAQKTANISGDGTTTATVLAQHIIHAGLEAVEAGANPMELKRGIDKAVDAVVGFLKQMTTTIDNEKINSIAIIAANNDLVIGNLIGDAFKKIGKDGIMRVDDSKTAKTHVSIVDGFSFDRGYISPYFATNPKMTCEYENPYILICDKKITMMQDLIEVIKKVYPENSTERPPLVIICDEMDGEALGMIVQTKVRGGIPLVAVKAPFFAEYRKSVLEDIAIVTGGTPLSDETGISLESAQLMHLGQCEKIIISENETLIIKGKGNKQNLINRIESIKSQIESSQDEYQKEMLQSRLAKISGTAAILYVGATSEVEMREKKDRIDDAIRATKAAIEEGIVPGGGTALVRCLSALEVLIWRATADEWKGVSIIKNALSAPLRQIIANTGGDVDFITGTVMNKKFKNSWYKKEPYQTPCTMNEGYNAKTDRYENLVTTGVIDPTKVVRVALENAASVAGMMLTSECLIVEEKSKENK